MLIVDGSRYQYWEGRSLDFQKMKDQGVAGIIWRVTVGDYYVDPTFEPTYYGAKENGLFFGAYYVTAPADGNGRRISAQAHIDLFLKTIDGKSLDIPHTMDAELERGQDRTYITHINQWCITHTPLVNGLRPHIYTRQSFWDRYVLPWSGWSSYGLHAARYADIPGPWSDGYFKFRDWDGWVLHQFSADGNGLGKAFGVYSASIDLNRFNGTREQFFAYIGKTEEPPMEDEYVKRLEALERGLVELRNQVSKDHQEILAKIGGAVPSKPPIAVRYTHVVTDRFARTFRDAALNQQMGRLDGFPKGKKLMIGSTVKYGSIHFGHVLAAEGYAMDHKLVGTWVRMNDIASL